MAEVPLLHIDGLRIGPDVPSAGVSLEIWPGETHAVIGPPHPAIDNLAVALAGAPTVPVIGGRVRFRGDDITDWSADVRATSGLFLSLPGAGAPGGITLLQLLAQAVGARRGVETDIAQIGEALLGAVDRLGIDPRLLDRHIDQERSATEIRWHEILQLAVLEPDLAILDEPDPDLPDEAVDALVRGIASVRGQRPTLGTLAITHCRRLIDQLQPDHVHILVGGRIVATGGPALATRLETQGYESFT